QIGGQRGGVCSVAFSPDGRALVCSTWNRDRAMRLWDVATGKALPSPEGELHYVFSAAFSADGKLVAGGSRGGESEGVVCLWDAATGKELRRIRAHVGDSGGVRS